MTSRQQIVIVILFHTGVIIGQNYAHQQIDEIFLAASSSLIFNLFILLPLIGMALLFTSMYRYGLVVLIGVLPVEIIFHIYIRFILRQQLSNHTPTPIWQIFYEASFGATLVCEVLAFWTALRLLREYHKLNSSETNKANNE